jgi:serine protease Do
MPKWHWNGSPAAGAGLRAGDVILAVNGSTITDSAQLHVLVADTRRHHDHALVLAQRRDPYHASRSRLRAWGADRSRSARRRARQRGRLDGARAHARRTPGRRHIRGRARRAQHGPVAVAGIEPGDIILMFDNARVSNATQFRDTVATHSHPIALLVLRHGERRFVTIEPG